jgi:hypothetical protein
LHPYIYPADKHEMKVLNYYFAAKYKLINLNQQGTFYIYPLFNLGASTAIDGKKVKMKNDPDITLDQDSGYFYGLGMGLNLDHFIFELMFTKSFYKYTGTSSSSENFQESGISYRYDWTLNGTSEITINTLLLTVGYRFGL